MMLSATQVGDGTSSAMVYKTTPTAVVASGFVTMVALGEVSALTLAVHECIARCFLSSGVRDEGRTCCINIKEG